MGGIWNHKRALSEQSLRLTFWKITLTRILAKGIYQKESRLSFRIHGEKVFTAGGLTCGRVWWPWGELLWSWNCFLFRLIFWERPVVEGANSDIFFHISGVVINKKRTLVNRKGNVPSNLVAATQLQPIVAMRAYRHHVAQPSVYSQSPSTLHPMKA